MCVVCLLIEKMSLSKVPFHGLPVIGKIDFSLFLIPCICCVVYLELYLYVIENHVTNVHENTNSASNNKYRQKFQL